jgi:hypothetical protein
MPCRTAIIFFALIVLFLTGCSPRKLQIISAVYGSGTHFADVSARVNDLVQQTAGFDARPEWLKADPTPGWNKQLMIVYEVSGHRHVFTANEGDRISATILLTAAAQQPAHP